MDGTAKLLMEAVKSNDSMQSIDFVIGGKEFSFKFRYLTMLEKMRIKQMCVKTTETINTDGSKTVKHEEQEHLYPIYLILEKALNEDGKRVFSSTNKEHYNTIASLPVGVSSLVAYEMSQDIFGNLEVQQDGE